jgi:4'-phosphopantetheinyl transferase
MDHRCGVDVVTSADLVVVPRGRPLAPDDWATLVKGLPGAEQRRIGSVYRNDDQQDSAIGWSLLCRLADDHGVSVWRNSAGRPVTDPPVDISLSHGGGWIAVAASRAGRVGVDVEAVRDVSPALARRCLSPAEVGWMESAPGARDRQERFLRLWTAKEAYLKAIGTGLGVDPRSFTLDCSSPAPRLRGAEGRRWLFRSGAPADGVCVTVCEERAG